MPSTLGLDEIKYVLEMISPEYRPVTHVSFLFVGLEPYLSKDDRTAVCSLSLTCKALRAGAQRVLMRYIYISARKLPGILPFLVAKYRDEFPVRKLTVWSPFTSVASDAPKRLMELLSRCPELEFLSLDGREWIPEDSFDPAFLTPNIQFERLLTFQYFWNQFHEPARILGCMTAAMPRLRNLFADTEAYDITPTANLDDLFGCQLEILKLSTGDCGRTIRWILSNSAETLHTLQLLRLHSNPELMNALAAFLEIAGSRIRVLHIWGGTFQYDSIVSLVHACPNLEDLGIDHFRDDRIVPVEGDGTQQSAAQAEQVDAHPTTRIINALRLPLLRLHVICDPHSHFYPPPGGYRLPALCGALRRGHEKLSMLEQISLEVMGALKGIGNEYFNLDLDKGIGAICKERGLRLRYSTLLNIAEWDPE